MMTKDTIKTISQRARTASNHLLTCRSADKRAALHAIVKCIDNNREAILSANTIDVENANKEGLSSAMVDRLILNDNRIDAMISGVLQIAAQEDPIGRISELKTVQRGFKVGRMRTPIGVIGMIYESRPNVTVDASAICLQSGNACILRGGSEAFHSNKVLVDCMRSALRDTPLDENLIQFIDTTDREAVTAMLEASGLIDVIIPRGGKRLVEVVTEKAKVPVIKHLEGICHVYIDTFADNAMAIDIAVNAKTFRYGICGAMEKLLVHQDKVDAIMPELLKQFDAKDVTLVMDEVLAKRFNRQKAENKDWATEYLDAKLAIKVVTSIDEAIAHINDYGSHHTDAIVTDSITHQNQFLMRVDSASVMVNTPTCFADGFEYGLGAEIGISTDKLHARGPVGVLGLTTEKFIVLGNGELRS